MRNDWKNNLSTWILAGAVSLGGIYFVYERVFHSFGDFINSNFFIAVVTSVVGSIALFLYLKQKSDEKMQAARVLLIEIRSAEERITQIKNMMSGGDKDDFPMVFTTSSWKKYSHLFISDFDQDELKLINNFYDYGELLEEFCKRDNNFFWIRTEERARVVENFSATLILSNEKDKSKEGEDISKEIIEKISNHNLGGYAPQKTILKIKTYADKISYITITSVGEKLKKLAKMF